MLSTLSQAYSNVRSRVVNTLGLGDNSLRQKQTNRRDGEASARHARCIVIEEWVVFVVVEKFNLEHVTNTKRKP